MVQLHRQALSTFKPRSWGTKPQKALNPDSLKPSIPRALKLLANRIKGFEGLGSGFVYGRFSRGDLGHGGFIAGLEGFRASGFEGTELLPEAETTSHKNSRSNLRRCAIIGAVLGPAVPRILLLRGPCYVGIPSFLEFRCGALFPCHSISPVFSRH